jgi:hypothetical protein
MLSGGVPMLWVIARLGHRAFGVSLGASGANGIDTALWNRSKV